MKLAVLGGSFNPVHLGHLYLADAVLSGFGYDRVIFIPAFQSPFKLGAPAPSPKDRLDMLAASICGDSRLLIDDCEIRREGVSYTVDTLADLIRRYLPDGKPGLILGDDLGQDFPKWKDFDKIISQADVIIARRILSEAVEYPYPCVQMRNDVMQISSAQVRELILQGKHWRCLIPAGARVIIEERGLYGYTAVPAAGAAGPALIARMEEEARRRLSQPRFLHSRQVAAMASDLCRIFGLDSRAGYLAGITHDIGKQLGEEELFKLAKTDKRVISALEKRKPSLLHGRAGAALLKKEYGIRDQEILDAVAFHTTGSPAMGPLSKVIYIADKLEFSREGVEPRLRDFSEYAGTGERGLDRLFEKILRETIAWLRIKNIDPSEDALKLLAKLEGGSPR
ncbi:MAG: nicotinate (nicotinamide) nucleotide adenylyltransferase [Treponema sp.]|jgi:nicotinate-nucleotide adenylyltransferase|nr:nicotinate (nicotinamide) nucleotide adenylyltransferase [Treponema sp.]